MDHKCIECGGATLRLRKDRCNACYMRLYRGGELPLGACCAGCQDRRREVLQNVELEAGVAVLCGNCGLIFQRTRPKLRTVRDVIRRIARDRRLMSDRRQADSIFAPDRRSEPRRSTDLTRARATPFDPALD